MLYSKHWESNKQGHERVDDFGVGRIRSKVLQLGLQTLNQQDVREDILLIVFEKAFHCEPYKVLYITAIYSCLHPTSSQFAK